MKGQKVGGGGPFPYEIAQLVDSNHPTPRALLPCQRDHTLSMD